MKQRAAESTPGTASGKPPPHTEVPPEGTSVFELTRQYSLDLVSLALSDPRHRTIARGLAVIRAALLAGDLGGALRQVDRAWRQQPSLADTLASLYGCLLSLDGADLTAALGLLRRARESAPDPHAAALSVHALLRLQRVDEARRQLSLALHDYCVEPAGLLAGVAGLALRHPGFAAPGWIGRAPDLSVVGELLPGEPNVIDLSLDGGTPFTQMVAATSHGGAHRFHVTHPEIGGGVRLAATARGSALLGGDAQTPLDFCLDGRAQGHGRKVAGWVRLGWSPTRPVALRFADEHGVHTDLLLGRRPRPGWRWPFAMDLRTAGMRGNEIHISGRLPDGQWRSLPDAPLLLQTATRARRASLGRWKAGDLRTRPRPPLARRTNLVDVIIPVHGGRTESLACIESVLRTLGQDARLIVVDDASDDAALVTDLDALATAGHIQLLRNTRNLGFVASVNRGLRLHPTRDALVLNSDTLVFADWLERLRTAAYSAANVGTVTPLTNSGSIASYPHAAPGVIDAEAAAALHHLAARVLADARVEIPVGVGFCLYIRRDCLREVGELDAAVFGKGYGEETDFCLRARARGWSHQLAADVFVYHAGGRSFAGRRQALLERSQRLLNLKHPGYDRFIAGFLRQDPLHGVRRRLDECRLRDLKGRFVLLVTLSLPGGVDRYVRERSESLRSQGLHPLVLRPTSAGRPARCELWTDALEVPNLQFNIPRDLGALQALLTALDLESVEIQHFMGLDARVLEMVRALPVAYDVVIHDYSWICPRVTLIDGSNRYCGEPDASVCQSCVRRNGSKLTEPITVAALRARSATWLRAARRVIAPSADAARRLRGHIRDLPIEVRPHAATGNPAPLARRRLRRAALRVALIGAIGTHKGFRILLECARDARRRELPIEFVVIGHTENDAPLLATGKVFVTGHYNEPEAVHLIEREEPDVAWLPSVWPETWCYALDYALNAALPVAAFDIGAIAERLRGRSAATLMPLDSPASQINDRLLAVGRRHVDFTIVEETETLVPHTRDDAKMHANITEGMPMTKSSNGSPARSDQQTRSGTEDGLSASVQVLPLPPGLYLFSVKSASPAAAAQGQLSLPAMHVGLGPGVRADQVEFIAGPSTHGAWLFTPGDLLVTRVNGSGATLVLTSVRAPGGEVLSIKVERLEDRRDEPGPSLPAAAAQANAAAPAQSIGKPLFDAAGNVLPLPVQIVAHIRTRGDLAFAHVPWAGRVAPGLWIEAFAIQPLDRFGASDIEYKGLTGSGFETPWLSDHKMCGTKGMATPLVGFAIRLKPSPAAAAFDCEYSGYFQSGVIVGPMRNGAPCRSSVANDSLEGIQLRIVKRAAATLPLESKTSTADHKPKPEAVRTAAARRPPPTTRGKQPARRPHSRRP